MTIYFTMNFRQSIQTCGSFSPPLFYTCLPLGCVQLINIMIWCSFSWRLDESSDTCLEHPNNLTTPSPVDLLKASLPFPLRRFWALAMWTPHCSLEQCTGRQLWQRSGSVEQDRSGTSVGVLVREERDHLSNQYIYIYQHSVFGDQTMNIYGNFEAFPLNSVLVGLN